MKHSEFISASIVLYEENAIELAKTIECFLKTPLEKKLFLIDNSSTERLRKNIDHPDIEYRFIGKNIGFGSGHNTIINEIKELSDYHLVLNPDVIFEPKVIPNLIQEIQNEKEVSIIAPKVLFPNGQHQFSCRKFPSLLELVVRRLGFLKPLFRSIIEKGEYRNEDLSKPFYVDSLTGCFQLFRTTDFIKVKGFDERYFLYMEDVDLCKKIEMIKKKKLYYPNEKIYHVLRKGSSKNIKLFFHHISSIFKYFYKWNILIGEKKP